MKIEIILLGIIGLVFLIDFILNSRKKIEIDKKITIKELDESKSSQLSLQIFLVLFNVLIFIIPVAQGGSIFYYIESNWAYEFEFYTDIALKFYHLFLLNLPLIPLLIFLNKNKNSLIFLNYIANRKKNFIGFLLLIPVLKILIHYFFYPITAGGRMALGAIRPRARFGQHIDATFTDELFLFIPAIVLVSFIAWFFNDKIKAR